MPVLSCTVCSVKRITPYKNLNFLCEACSYKKSLPASSNATYSNSGPGSVFGLKTFERYLPSKLVVSSSQPDTSVNYADYLGSSGWSKMREEAFKTYGKRCQICLNTSSLHVHHKTYEHLGHEFVDELAVLCSKCHDQLHKEFLSYKSRRSKRRKRVHGLLWFSNWFIKKQSGVS